MLRVSIDDIGSKITELETRLTLNFIVIFLKLLQGYAKRYLIEPHKMAKRACDAEILKKNAHKKN